MRHINEYLINESRYELNVSNFCRVLNELFNGEEAEMILFNFKENGKKSIFDAIDKCDDWDLLWDFMDFSNYRTNKTTTITLKDFVKKNDKELTEFVNNRWGKYIDREI